MLSKGRLPIIEGCNVQFITDISGTVARGDYCVGVAIKCSIHNSQLRFLNAIHDFKAQELRSIPTSPMTALMESFHTDAEINV